MNARISSTCMALVLSCTHVYLQSVTQWKTEPYQVCIRKDMTHWTSIFKHTEWSFDCGLVICPNLFTSRMSFFKSWCHQLAPVYFCQPPTLHPHLPPTVANMARSQALQVGERAVRSPPSNRLKFECACKPFIWSKKPHKSQRTLMHAHREQRLAPTPTATTTLEGITHTLTWTLSCSKLFFILSLIFFSRVSQCKMF